MRNFAAVFFLVLLLAPAAHAEEPFYTPAQALDDLRKGNLRFLAGKSIHPRQGMDERQHSLKRQHPKAVVLACADARVPVELLFDQGVDDLMVIRVPGNIAGPQAQVAVWYAVSRLNVPLVVVLGHTDCDAVITVLHGEDEGLLPELSMVARAVKAGKEAAGASDARLIRMVTNENVRHSLDRILESQPGLADRISRDFLRMAGGVYDLKSGKVEWMDY